jgi:hypothetical protein
MTEKPQPDPAKKAPSRAAPISDRGAESLGGAPEAGAADGAQRGASVKQPIWKRRPAMVGALLAVVLSAFILTGKNAPSGERNAPAWNEHIEQLNQQFDPRFEDTNEAAVEMKKVDASGRAEMTRHIQLGPTDLDPGATQSVYDAMRSTPDPDARHQAMQDVVRNAQVIPSVQSASGKGDLPVKLPELTPGMISAFESGHMEMWRLFLYDNCDEDGDVVDVLLNGVTFAVVPNTHQGATLSIPLARGTATSIALRGVKDGGGGITVSCRTSTGTYFSRAMYPGEVQMFGTVGR